MPPSVRVYECATCGLVIDRDYNGSKNILEEALEAMGRHGCVIPEAPGAGAVGSRHELHHYLQVQRDDEPSNYEVV